MDCRSGGIGRRARFRSVYSQGCGGSSPPFGTKDLALDSIAEEYGITGVRMRRMRHHFGFSLANTFRNFLAIMVRGSYEAFVEALVAPTSAKKPNNDWIAAQRCTRVRGCPPRDTRGFAIVSGHTQSVCDYGTGTRRQPNQSPIRHDRPGPDRKRLTTSRPPAQRWHDLQRKCLHPRSQRGRGAPGDAL